MSTDATSADKPVSSVGSTVTPTSAPTVDKGKAKDREGEGEDDEDEDEDEEDDEMDEDDDDEDEDEDVIKPSVIVPRRTRGIKVDYTSNEALQKAGLKPDEDGDEDEGDSFDPDDDAMKH